jgi:non-lysosomal glucosylceramidase
MLLENYSELLVERVIIDTNGEEINGRLKGLVKRASADALENQKEAEPFDRAVVRNALRRLNYNYCQITLGGLPTGPAYERSIPDPVGPKNFGHEKVNYPMSDYPQLSYLPVGGLGSPLYEIDNTTFYLKAGHMIQDPIHSNDISVKIETAVKDLPLRHLSAEEGTYYALFPFSERSYNFEIPISVVQFSPIIPGNYHASSLPVELIEVIAENPTNEPVTVTFTVSRENILGWRVAKGKDNPKDPNAILAWKKDGKNNIKEAFTSGNITGVILKKKGDQKKFIRDGVGITGQIALASKNIPGLVNVKSITQQPGTAGAIAITFTLLPGEKIKHPVVVAYDNPFYFFQKKATDPKSHGIRMPKFYTRLYDTTGQNAQAIAADALNNFTNWRTQVSDFQDVILEDPDLPDFFQQALLNELYILTETGIWEADRGRFAYLESIDYKMYNTSDVNSYTWAILTLYPKLEKKDLLEFARLVPLSDPTRLWYGTDRWTKIVPPKWKHLYWAPVKEAGTVCHDLGGFQGNGIFPFTNTCNAFNWSNANMWIDLAPKFALRVWRYYTFIHNQTGEKDTKFIKTVYPSVRTALDTLENRWADKTTHVPVSKGIPDWTYDTISGKGYTPNVVTQWLGALQAAQKMATLVGDNKSLEKYQSWFKAGKPVLEKLWNKNGYYNAFSALDGSKPNTNIHSDMLFGDFYARMTGLKPIVPNDRATEALMTIYNINGLKWSQVGNHGPLGLVNLRGFDGKQHKTEQGDEGWTGAMLLNAAYQIKLGTETNNQTLIDNGWKIVHGFYNVVYSHSPDSQHWFGRTPEGYVNPADIIYNSKTNTIYGKGKKLPDGKTAPATGRAPKYMRALAIWAIYAAIKNNQLPFNFYLNNRYIQRMFYPGWGFLSDL